MVQKEKTSIHGHGPVQMEHNFMVGISTLVINTLEMRKGWRALTQRLFPKLL